MPNPGGQGATNTPAPRTEGTTPAKGEEEGKHPLEGNLTVRSAPRQFSGNIVIDMVVLQLWSWTGPTVKLVKFDVTATPSLTITTEVKAEAAATQEWEFFPTVEIPLAVVPIGPVEVTPELDLTLKGKLQALASLTLTASSTLSQTMEYGFIYTEANGGSLINPGPKNNNSGSMTIKGEAGFTALAEFEGRCPSRSTASPARSWSRTSTSAPRGSNRPRPPPSRTAARAAATSKGTSSSTSPERSGWCST